MLAMEGAMKVHLAGWAVESAKNKKSGISL
jgi:hypothetical protein